MNERIAFNYSIVFNGNTPEAWSMENLVTDAGGQFPTFNAAEVSAIVALQPGQRFSFDGGSAVRMVA